MLPRLTLAVSIAAAALFAANDASAITCTASVTTPGTTTVDIVGNNVGSATATVTVNQDCSSGFGERNQYFCWYIDPAATTARDNSSYYLTATGDSRLAWTLEKTAGSTAGRLVQRYGTSGATAGGGCSNFTGRCVGPLNLTLRFLDRQQQDRVRASSPAPLTPYSNTFTLKTLYGAPPAGTSIESWCANPTGAGTLTNTFTVSAFVPTKCQFESLGDVDFGSWGAIAAASSGAGGVQATGKVEIRCTYQTPYSITIGDGQNASAGIRQMKSGANLLAYQLYQPGCTIPWTTASPLQGTGNTVNNTNTHAVCGRLITPLASAPAAGTYTDLVVVTATF